MKLGLIQTKQNQLYDFQNSKISLSQDEVERLQQEMIDQNIKLMKQACNLGCEVLVTTEAINFCGQQAAIRCDYETVIPTLKSPMVKHFSELAKERKVYLIVGVYNKRQGKFYNSAIVFNKEGEQVLIYDKVHLAGSEKDQLTHGDRYKVWESEFGKIGICICWDMQFPEVARELVLEGADLIVCLTWGWEQIYGHARAYENGVFVASSMAIPYREAINGIRNPSEVISPLGQIIAQGSRQNAEVVCCEIEIEDCKAHKILRMQDRHPGTYIRIANPAQVLF